MAGLYLLLAWGSFIWEVCSITLWLQ